MKHQNHLLTLVQTWCPCPSMVLGQQNGHCSDTPVPWTEHGHKQLGVGFFWWCLNSLWGSKFGGHSGWWKPVEISAHARSRSPSTNSGASAWAPTKGYVQIGARAQGAKSDYQSCHVWYRTVIFSHVVLKLKSFHLMVFYTFLLAGKLKSHFLFTFNVSNKTSIAFLIVPTRVSLPLYFFL